MNILVVGGTRFFGIPMVKKLVENGHRITLATRGNRTDPFGNSVQRLIMDKTDENSVKSALCGKSFDVVIDKAAYSSNDVRSLLANTSCDRYIQMSSCAVYESAHTMIKEDEFDPKSCELIWLDRPTDYALGKRQAERAALEFMDSDSCTFVRYPVVMGEHDYTGRARFYVRHILQGKPIRLENPDASTAYINETEAGEFMAQLAETDICGGVNGCSKGVISQRQMIEYIQNKCSVKAVISPHGDAAPYDGTACDTSYDCTKAEGTGHSFSHISQWLFGLFDSLISGEK